MNLEEAQDVRWDVIVVGAGMGGGTAGYALARAGRRVLFVEKGLNALSAPMWTGKFAEQSFPRPSVPTAVHGDLLARAGRWTDAVIDSSGRKPHTFIPFIGSGVGGSSALYGMVLERLDRRDFSPRQHFPDVADSSLPAHWPVSYDELRPYYRSAEQLYGVVGEPDPLRLQDLDALPPPPPMMPASRELCDFLRTRHLHPYRLPTACRLVPTCQGCQGFLCPQACKNDAGLTCVRPAVTEHGASVLSETRAVRLESRQGKVTGLLCQSGQRQATLRGDIVILAAGALETPCLLLRSRNSDHPEGLANESGLVGRNLMRHYVDLYPVFLRRQEGLGDGRKEMGFSDWYCDGQVKLGVMQAFGVLPPPAVIAEHLEHDLASAWGRWLAAPFKLVKPLVRQFLAARLSKALILASIVEDLPYTDNIVAPAADERSHQIQYRIRPAEKHRIRAMRTRTVASLQPYKFMKLFQAENNERLAHVCGTCRFGDDPAASVLNRNNRAHSLENLFVVDASFFPSSAGINPALTIAANALRVADHIVSGKG